MQIFCSNKTCQQMENAEHKVENDIYGEEDNSEYDDRESNMEYSLNDRHSVSENLYEIAADEPAIYEVPK